MPKFTVRITGSAVVWADVEVEAANASDALDKVSDTDPANTAHWQFSEGGNGVDDWTTTGEVYDQHGNEIDDPEATEATA